MNDQRTARACLAALATVLIVVCTGLLLIPALTEVLFPP